MLVIDGNGSPRAILAEERQRVAAAFHAYLERKYGSPDFQGARLEANLYDRNQSPPFLAYDTSAVYPALLATVLPTKQFTVDEVIAMRNLIEAQTRNVPEQGGSISAIIEYIGDTVNYSQIAETGVCIEIGITVRHRECPRRRRRVDDREQAAALLAVQNFDSRWPA